MYLMKVDFTQRTVFNPRMLKDGGAVGPGSYSRTRHNAPVSTGLLKRMEYAAKVMREKCSLPDACMPGGMSDRAIGAPVPGSPGKTYRKCTVEEAASRLKAARECGKTNLSTKGGVYGSA